MVPKVIHYCWLSGDPYPRLMKQCMKTWKEKLPDYEFVKWDLNRFSLGKSLWVKSAFEAKKYAFAADYIRIYALYHFGGIYLDSDVQVLKSFNELLDLPYFIGQENKDGSIEAATMGFEKGHPLLKRLLEYYEGRSFIKDDGTMDMQTVPNIILKHINDSYHYRIINNKKDFDFSQDTICVFPPDYFSPKDCDTKQVSLTNNTYSIHHFDGSWVKPSIKEVGFWKYLRIKLALRTRIMKLFDRKQ